MCYKRGRLDRWKTYRRQNPVATECIYSYQANQNDQNQQQGPHCANANFQALMIKRYSDDEDFTPTCCDTYLTANQSRENSKNRIFCFLDNFCFDIVLMFEEFSFTRVTDKAYLTENKKYRFQKKTLLIFSVHTRITYS